MTDANSRMNPLLKPRHVLCFNEQKENYFHGQYCMYIHAFTYLQRVLIWAAWAGHVSRLLSHTAYPNTSSPSLVMWALGRVSCGIHRFPFSLDQAWPHYTSDATHGRAEPRIWCISVLLVRYRKYENEDIFTKQAFPGNHWEERGLDKNLVDRHDSKNINLEFVGRRGYQRPGNSCIEGPPNQIRSRQPLYSNLCTVFLSNVFDKKKGGKRI